MRQKTTQQRNLILYSPDALHKAVIGRPGYGMTFSTIDPHIRHDIEDVSVIAPEIKDLDNLFSVNEVD